MHSEAEHSLLHLLHRATQISVERFALATENNGLSIRRVQVLAAIADTEGCNQTELVRRTGIDRSTMADLIGRLARDRLVRRRRSKDDARANAIHLTTDGHRALQRALPAIRQIERDFGRFAPALATELAVLVKATSKKG